MANFGVKILVNKLNKISKEVEDEVKFIIEDVVKDIEIDAIRNAPSAGDNIPLNSSSISKGTQNAQKINTGINQFISSSISPNGLSGEVFIEKGATELAIYIEFGTGITAANYVPTLPTEFQEVAKKYYINGKGTIYKQPYFLPAWFKHSPTVIPRIKKAIKNIEK